MKANKLSVLLTSSATVALGLALNASPVGAEEITNEEGIQEQPEENIVLEVKDTPKEQAEGLGERPDETAPPSKDNLNENIDNQSNVQTLENNTTENDTFEAPVEDNNLNNQQLEENTAVTSVKSAEPVQNVNPKENQYSYSPDYNDQEVEDYLANYGNVNQEVSPYAQDQAQYINDTRAEKNEAIDNGTAEEIGVIETDYYAPKVEVDDDLSKIAYWKAKDMAVNGYFSHDTPDGQKVSEQYKEAYEALGKESPYNQYGENISLGNGANNDDEVSKEMYHRWYKSNGHRKNIENPKFTHVGYGSYADPLTGYTYGVQVFGGEYYDYQNRIKKNENPNLPKGKVKMSDFGDTYEKGSLRKDISGEYASNKFPLKMENPQEYKRVPFVTGDGDKEDVEEKPSTPTPETSVKTDKNGNKLTELAKIDDYGYSITTSLDVTDENKPYIDNAVEKVKEEMAKHANNLRSHGINYDAFVEKFPFEVNLVSIKDLPNAGRYYTRFDGPNRTNPVGILELAVSPKKNHITHMLVTHEFSHHTGFRWVHAVSRDHFNKVGEVINLDATVSENERRPKWKNSNVEKYGEAYTQAFVKGHSNRSATGNLTDEEITAFIELVKNEMNKVGGAPVENNKETDSKEQTQQPSEGDSNVTEDNSEETPSNKDNKEQDDKETPTPPSEDNKDIDKGEDSEDTTTPPEADDKLENDNKDLDNESNPSESNEENNSKEETPEADDKNEESDENKEDDNKENTPTPSEDEDLDNNTDENTTPSEDNTDDKNENDNNSESKDEDNNAEEAPEGETIVSDDLNFFGKVIDDILADIENREDGVEENDIETDNKQSTEESAEKESTEENNQDKEDSALIAVENNDRQSKDTTDASKAPAEEINKDAVNKDATEAQNTDADEKKVLPDTGEAQSPLTALFAGILGMAGIALTIVFSPRRRKNN